MFPMALIRQSLQCRQRSIRLHKTMDSDCDPKEVGGQAAGCFIRPTSLFGG